jgi:hypothetical protein
MATITITITESVLHLLAGIPSYVTLDANMPSTIFYTLDGSEPTTDSFVAIGPIDMPRDHGQVILRAYATDGINTSSILTQTYTTTMSGLRNPNDKVVQDSCGCSGNSLFGSGNVSLPVYENTTGVIVDDQALPRTPDGYDGTATGTGAGYLNQDKSRYQFLFSESDAIGNTGKGIGTLPGRVLYSKPRNNNTVQQSTNTSSPLFNPKAMVIFQDSREEQYDKDIPRINRPHFDLEDHTKVRDGALINNQDVTTTAGAFVRAHYNPADNTLTYYYYDNRTGRWIISKEPYSHAQNPVSNLAGMVPGREQSAGKVFKWVPFKYRTLI